MKIINGKQLAHMPNGTVFSDITDRDFDPNGAYGDMIINGLNIMCGHDNYFTPESGNFNGVLPMLQDVPCYKTEIACLDKENIYTDVYDIDMNDYTENDWVVVFEREEVERIIENLQWALDGCKED